MITPNQLQGKGVFFYGDKSLEKDFTISLYPNVIYIFIDSAPLDCVLDRHTWKLVGNSTEGVRIESDNLFPISLGNDGCQFYVNSLFVGNKPEKIDTVNFPLIGYYEEELSFIFNEFKISTTGKKKTTDERRLYKRGRIAQEGLILQFDKSNQDLSDTINLGRVISTLLSLVSGNDVIFNRQILNNTYTVYRAQKGENYGFASLIPHYNINSYIIYILPVWLTLTESDQKLIKRMVGIINSAADVNDNLSFRFFKVAQCWEIAAQCWAPEDTTVDEIKEKLNAKLKEAYSTWKKEFPKYDTNGALGQKVSDSLKGLTYINKLENLIKKFSLNNDKLSIDLKLMKNSVRDKVAHEGEMLDFEGQYDQFEKSMFGIRLIILKKLSYNGPVEWQESGFVKSFHINDFFL